MDQLLESLPPEIAEALPDEIKQQLLDEMAARMEQIEQIGQAIAKKRDEAVKGRAGQNIEEEWAESEDQYQGIDDANRNEAKVYKPLSSDGSATIPRQNLQYRSTVFLNITRPYTDAAVARVTDMLLPTDERNWGIKPTPVPQLEELAKLKTQVSPPAAVPPTVAAPPGPMPAAPGMPPQGGRPPMPPQGGPMPPNVVPMPGMMPTPPQPDPLAQAVAEATRIMALAKKKADMAQSTIEDWLVECQYHSEVRKVFEDCGRLGTGILKGPFPIKKKRRQVQQTPEGMALTMSDEINPASRRVDPWNFFPDPACGEDIHNGQYVVERDYMTPKQLIDLKGLPGYLPEQIDKVLDEGPGKKNTGGKSPYHKESTGSDPFEIWYYTGYLEAEELETLGVEFEEGECECHELMPAIVTLVNDTPIKASLNPLDSGDFPYDMIPWQRRAGMCWGIGIPQQVRAAQRIINGATRNMMDNAGLSGGPQLVIRRNLIEPADKTWALTPRKIWFAREDGDMRTVADAITAINIPSMQGDLMGIIQFALKMAEDTTGLPMIMQGQLGKAPDTVGGMTMLQNNASTVLRRIARTFDDCVTEPHIRRYYEWLMQHGPDEAKGDYSIDARGSSALVERDLANQALLQMGALVGNPAFGIDPEKWIKEAMAAQRIDPAKVLMDDEKKAQMAQQKPPPPPQIMAAEIRARADLEKEKMRAQVDMAEAKMEQDRDAIYVQAETARTQSEHQARMQELIIKRELAMLDYANKRQITLEQIKADLASDAMKLRTQKELAAASNAMKAPQVAEPAVEPQGRAPNGFAFQR